MDTPRTQKISIAPADVDKMRRFQLESDAMAQGYVKGMRDAQVILARLFAESKEEAEHGGQSNS